MKYYVGLDVSMKETFVCIENELGKVVHQGHVSTEPKLIAEYIKKFQISVEKVGIESGSISHWLVDELRKMEIPAICIDARKMATILSVQVNKTDKNDARGISQAMRCGLYKEVSQKSHSSIEIATLMGCRRLLVEQRVQTSNAIRGFLKTYGIRLGAVGEASFVQKVNEKISDKHSFARQGLEALLKSYASLVSGIKDLTRRVEELVEDNEDAKRLTSIPGVGTITAMSFLVEIDDPKRFKNSRAVGAYLGMTPIQYSSGETTRQGRVSKCGSTETRSLLTEAAAVLLTRSKKWSKLKAWGLKIQRKHGFKKATVAVGRKLAVIMHKMLIDKTDFIHGEPKEQQKTPKAVTESVGSCEKKLFTAFINSQEVNSAQSVLKNL
jgi:transposase